MAIISISGAAGSGKDLSAKIIQEIFLDPKASDATLWLRVANTNRLDRNLGLWEVKKFAGTLKHIVASITGCSISDLESEKFKSQKLPLKWKRTYWEIVDEFGDVLHTYNNMESVSINFPAWKELVVSKLKIKRIEEHLTYRELLQKIGTDLFRNQFHEDIWVDSLLSSYSPSKKWIITDTRFPNELVAIKKLMGITLFINRKDAVSTAGTHISETALKSEKFDYYVDNLGSEYDLIQKLKLILIEEKLI